MCGILINLFCHSQMEACKNKGVFEIFSQNRTVKRTCNSLAMHLLRYLRALPTIRVHPELDGRALGIVHSFINLNE